MDSIIIKSIENHLEIITLLKNDEKLLESINAVAEKIIFSLKKNGRVIFCGNGGSASDSQHLATELVSRFYLERKAINAEAITVNTSSLTAIGNDYSFEKIFSRQIEATGKKGDILVGLTTSGNSGNIIEAIKTAKSLELITIGLTGGNKESLINKVADYCINVPSNDTPRIQEMHILIGHIICEVIEKEMFKQGE